jgi:hypothetical protein
MWLVVGLFCPAPGEVRVAVIYHYFRGCRTSLQVRFNTFGLGEAKVTRGKGGICPLC